MAAITLYHAQHANPDDGGNPTVAKVTAMAVLFACSLTLGCCPIRLNRCIVKGHSDTKNNRIVKMLLAFGGGVLLCTTFLHLVPEVSEKFEELDLTPDVEIHPAELLMCLGFFIMYFVEECVHVYLHRREKMADNMAPVARSLSIRRGEKEDSCFAESIEDNLHEDTDHKCSRHTDHSHLFVDNSRSTLAVIQGMLVVLALSIHELFEGLSVGLESSAANVWYMFGAVSAHKLVIAFCIGVELVTSGLRTPLVVVYVFIFAVVSPLGIGAGILLSDSEMTSADTVSAILQGLASGTLLYVVFFEILQDDRKNGLRQYVSIFGGFVVMFGIAMI
ncbi:zinc transporter ZIP1-like [Cylas formicarius]|uniref:zinc transporter ZIP1-like n=1 Tax=Cylas formicarius TaxID=197179 RepID=UPI002958B387|nr:zinc transporter ZIP1-like [Cylas formicarius]XP_060519412.1 zinc transporter ZIP1-like [Cylas formicarius]XP_060519413.1 zinc transporter ZIP1-like [Cylas formicarius]XP_060519414.1 zinc transporter ZIP1-like [Cylas formicarius]XP_060519415.1 zinc transporter ZIP1-like [Cylas formicarius]XP_060519416.1 zinc transporter ZIP1-like [Cylas formicarius]